MNKNTTSKDLLITSIVTTVTVIVWVMIDLFLTFKPADVSSVLKKQMEPINPKLDTTTLDNLEKKSGFEFSSAPQTQFQEPPVEVELPRNESTPGGQIGANP